MNLQPEAMPGGLQDDEISLAEIWHALMERFWLIALTTAIFGGIAVVIALKMTPIFRADVVVTVVEGSGKDGNLGGLSGQFGNLAAFAGVSLGGSTSRNEAVGTLSSRHLAENYVVRENLLPVLFEDLWDEQKNEWKPTVTKKPSLWLATNSFAGIRKVNDDKKTGLITLTVEWKDATLAAKWANGLVQLANDTMRQSAIKKSESNLAYLNAQLEKSSVVEVREAIFRLVESEVKNVMIAQGSSDFAFKVIDPAVVPERKAKPKRMLIVIVGAFLGLMISSFYALVTAGRAKRPRT